MNAIVTPEMREIAAGIAAATAHGIKAPGLCKVSGRHLSMAPNDAEFSDTAMQLGRQSVLQDKGLFAAWLDFQEDVREWSDYFGQISTWELFTLVLFNPGATDAQRKAACELIAQRYLEQESESVRDAAKRATEA